MLKTDDTIAVNVANYTSENINTIINNSFSEQPIVS